MGRDRRGSNADFTGRPFSIENNESAVYGDFIRRSFPNVPFPLLRPGGPHRSDPSETLPFAEEHERPVLYVMVVPR